MVTVDSARATLPVLALLVVYGGAVAHGADVDPSVPRYSVHEILRTASRDYSNPYTEVRVTARLTGPGGTQATLDGFWDGGRVFKVRFAPPAVGRWTWTLTSTDAGINGQSGAFVCVASKSAGGLRPRENYPRHFQRQDGTPVWFMGDTAWSLVEDDPREHCDRARVEVYLKQRAAQGFNAVSVMLLDEAGRGNRGGRPWDDLAAEAINPGYWREADERITFANAHGITVGLALAWGEKTGNEKYPWGRFPNREARERYARYIGARYSAYDVYFLVSGEWHGEVKNRKFTEAVVKSDFVALGNALQSVNANGRMIGIHPMTPHGSSREFRDAAWMSFADYQQNYFELHARVLESRRVAKPVVNGEYGYYLRDADGDGVVDKHHSYTAADMRNATWDIVMAGGYVVTGFGSTYMGGQRHPTAFLPEDPKNEPWIAQIGVVKTFFTGFDWWRLEPHDELLTCDTPRGRDRNSRIDIRDKQRTMNRAPETTYWCLAEPDEQYVLYLRGLSKPVAVKLPTGGTWRARELNPRTGAFRQLDGPTLPDRFVFGPPDTQDWVVVLTAEKKGPVKRP